MAGWIIFYLLDALYWAWIVYWGGARWLEGTIISGFIVNLRAPRWSDEGIKLFVWGQFILHTIWFIIGIFSPEVRFI